MKISKISGRPEYKELFKNRPFLVSKDFSIWVRNNNLRANFIRFGVIVVKKQIKKSVDRNKAKRIAKELFKLSFKQLQPSWIHNKDLVLVIKNFKAKEQNIWKDKLVGIYRWLDYFAGCQ